MPTPVDSHRSTNKSILASMAPDNTDAIVTLYRQVAAHAPLPIAMTAGPTHWLCAATPAFCQLLAADSAALLGQSLVDAVPASDIDRVRAILDQVYRTGAAALDADPQLVYPARDQGQLIYIVWPIPGDHGHPIGLVLLIRTITADQRDDHTLRDTRAVNEQLLLANLRERDLAEQMRQVQEAYTALLVHKHTLLEEQVQERTRELEQTNILLQAEINERKRTEQARQQLLQQLVIAQEEERRRIARDLHDQLGQSVTALMFVIKTLHHHIESASDLRPHMAALQALGSQLGQDVRTLAVQLRPPALDDFGLLPTITTYVAQWSAQASIVADLHSTGLENTRLPQLIETTVFRMLQEALTNIMRHAQATSVSVIMHRYADALHLIVEDDGVGFDPQMERQRSYLVRHFGLLGMEERVAQLAGTLTIESTPGSGTTLFVALPLARAIEKGLV